MRMRVQEAVGDLPARVLATLDDHTDAARWRWIDVLGTPEDAPNVLAALEPFHLDAMAVRDALDDRNMPKVDDFGSSQVIVLHALAEDRIATFEVTCFLGADSLVSISRERSVSVDLLWDEVQHRPELAVGGPDELAARLADILTRRLFAVVDAFDDRIEGLVASALNAEAGVVADVTAVRSDLATVRKAVVPQREALDLLRHGKSPLVSEAGRRRFSDVFDVASRAAGEIDAGRVALAEALDAHRGAEASQATEVTKVLTIYAAIMLPLSLVAGFFGMNFTNLPWLDSDQGWIIVAAIMGAITLLSLGMFVALGWIRRPTSRRAGTALGRGLIEAARAPAVIVGAVLEISTTPLRRTRRSEGPPEF